MICRDISGANRDAFDTMYVCLIPQALASRIRSGSSLSSIGSPNPCRCVTGLRFRPDTSRMIFSNRPKSMKPRFRESSSRGHMTHSALQRFVFSIIITVGSGR